MNTPSTPLDLQQDCSGRVASSTITRTWKHGYRNGRIWYAYISETNPATHKALHRSLAKITTRKSSELPEWGSLYSVVLSLNDTPCMAPISSISQLVRWRAL